MSRPTPGPWIALKGAGWIVARPDARRRREPPLACGNNATTIVSTPHGYDADDEAKANAYLMAAAPDLRDALEELFTCYVGLAGSGDCGFWDPEEEPEVQAARAALAKAAPQQTQEDPA